MYTSFGRLKKNDNMDLHAYDEFMTSIEDEFVINYGIIAAEFINAWFCAVLVVRRFARVAP